MTQITRGTPVGPQRCLDALRGITSLSRDERHQWSATVAFWHGLGEIDVHESRILSAVLGRAAMIETEIEFDPAWVRTRLLDALSFIGEAGNAPLNVLEEVAAAIPSNDRRPFELDYLEAIETEIYRLRAIPPLPTPPRDTAARSPIGPEHAVLLVRGVTSPWPFPRGQAAQAVTELCDTGRLDRHEADTLSGVLNWAVLTEPDIPEVRAHLLATLSTLTGAGLVATDTRTQLTTQLAHTDLHPQERQAYDKIITGPPPAAGA